MDMLSCGDGCMDLCKKEFGDPNCIKNEATEEKNPKLRVESTKGIWD
jgi:hypothetical protein